MAAPEHRREAVLDELLGSEPLSVDGARRHRQIELAAVQPIREIQRPAGHERKPHVRCLRADRGQDRPRRNHGRIIVHRNREPPVRGRRVERVALDRELQLVERLANRKRQLLGAGSRAHFRGRTDKQPILERTAQPVERVTDGRLADGKTVRGAHHAALAQHRIEHQQQVEIEVPQSHRRQCTT
jgi:hypothetical protein